MIVTLGFFLDCSRDIIINTFYHIITWWQRFAQLFAQIRLQPPDPFDFKTPDYWPRWRRRFEQFRSPVSSLKSTSLLFSFTVAVQAFCVLDGVQKGRIQAEVFEIVSIFLLPLVVQWSEAT